VDELRVVHSVIVDDARKKWRRVQFFGGYYRVGPKVDKASAKIAALLSERAGRIARHGADDAHAAALLEKLSAMGIVLDERSKTWRRPRRTFEEQVRQSAERGSTEAGAAGSPAKKAGRSNQARKDWRGKPRAGGAKAKGAGGSRKKKEASPSASDSTPDEPAGTAPA